MKTRAKKQAQRGAKARERSQRQLFEPKAAAAGVAIDAQAREDRRALQHLRDILRE